MWDVFKSAQAIHGLLVILAAVGFFLFWIRTRYWFPRYVHYLAGFSLALGFGLLTIMPPDAPINRDAWGGLKKALLVLIFPALVYFFFVFYGGQKAAYERERLDTLVPCPYCGAARTIPETRCPGCGQTIT